MTVGAAVALGTRSSEAPRLGPAGMGVTHPVWWGGGSVIVSGQVFPIILILAIYLFLNKERNEKQNQEHS